MFSNKSIILFKNLYIFSMQHSIKRGILTLMKRLWLFFFLFLLIFRPLAQDAKPAGKNTKVDSALSKVDRAQFLPESLKTYADMDSSLPLSDGGRIPSKADIAFVLNSISTFDNPKVLIIGNNAGYCASVFAQLYPKVYLIETSKNSELYSKIFSDNGLSNITPYYGNSYDYFASLGPFDIIFVQGGVTTLTNLFTDQLKAKGELLIPIQDPHGFQQLMKYRKSNGNFYITSVGNTFFRILY